MVSINPGELREKVQFYSLNRVSDNGGGFDATEVLFLDTFAKVTTMRSVRGIEGAKLILKQPYEVIIRYRASHTPAIDMLFKYRGDTYTVVEITEVDVYKKLVKIVVVKE